MMADETGTTLGPSVDRRAMIRRMAAAGAAAWTAPIIVDSFASPAAAASCATGNFYIVLQSTTVNVFTTQTLVGTCSGSGTLTTRAAMGMTVTGGPMTHLAADPGSINPVVITMNATTCSNCRITAVKAYVHNIGAANCPANPCQTAAATGHLVVGPGALNTKSVTVRPSTVPVAPCATATHWGAGSGGVTNYMFIQINCS